VGAGRHPAPDRRGLGLPRRGHRRLVPPSRRLVDRRPPARRARRRRPRDGLPTPPTERRCDRAQRPRLPIHSWVFGQGLRSAGLLGSMGTIGDALDNAVAESFFASLQCELLDRRKWATRAELARAMFEWIEAFYRPAATRPSATSARSTPTSLPSRTLARRLKPQLCASGSRYEQSRPLRSSKARPSSHATIIRSRCLAAIISAGHAPRRPGSCRCARSRSTRRDRQRSQRVPPSTAPDRSRPPLP
jgi:hypothetical protein